ncbi:MAG: insulinase family protein [Bacteroidales bacterium]|nr:insulinase family protein [Bacteroidales bacterium]
MEYRYHTLNNGLRIIHLPTEAMVAHCGLFINAGSRDEAHQEQGIAHFIEHMLFKGTKRRKVYHVLSRLENIGADLNAYTTKEETCIYASFLKQYYARTLELLYDIIANSTFPPKEIKKEKDVVIDEINAYLDTPSEQIFDDYEELLFKGHPLANNILGTKETINSFDQAMIRRFMANYYHPGSMVICSVGNIRFKRLVKLVERYFSGLEPNERTYKREAFKGSKPYEKLVKKDTFQSHGIIGEEAYSLQDDRRFGLAVLTNLLGGPAMNSRLNLGVREKYGLSYHLEANYVPYTDTGVFNIYMSADDGSIERTIELVYRELKRLRERKLGIMQLKVAKQQFIGQLAITNEANINRMLGMGKNFLQQLHVHSIEEIERIIENLSAEELLSIANEIFDRNKMSMLIYKKA